VTSCCILMRYNYPYPPSSTSSPDSSCQGPTLLEWMPEVDLNMDVPSRHIHRGRSYTNVVFEPTNCLIVAASLIQAQFSSYDEDGNELWVPDGG